MLVWIQNEGTGKWSKETRENQSIRDLYKGFEMRGDRYLALALVLKPKDGYRVEVYKVTEFETEEVDSFFAALLSEVTEKLNEWSSTGPLTPLRPKISKIKAVLGGDSFVQNPVQKSEKGSYLIPVLSAKPKAKSVSCKPCEPCIQKPCVPDYKQWEEKVKLLETERDVLKADLIESKKKAEKAESAFEEHKKDMKKKQMIDDQYTTNIQTLREQLRVAAEKNDSQTKEIAAQQTKLKLKEDDKLKESTASKKVCKNENDSFDDFVRFIDELGGIGYFVRVYETDSSNNWSQLKVYENPEDFEKHSNTIRNQVNTFINTSPWIVRDFSIRIAQQKIFDKLYQVLKSVICEGKDPTPENINEKLEMNENVKNITDVLTFLDFEELKEIGDQLKQQLEFFTESDIIKNLTGKKVFNTISEADEVLAQLKSKNKWFTPDELQKVSKSSVQATVNPADRQKLLKTFLKNINIFVDSRRKLAQTQLNEFNAYKEKQSLIPKPTK